MPMRPLLLQVLDLRWGDGAWLRKDCRRTRPASFLAQRPQRAETTPGARAVRLRVEPVIRNRCAIQTKVKTGRANAHRTA